MLHGDDKVNRDMLEFDAVQVASVHEVLVRNELRYRNTNI